MIQREVSEKVLEYAKQFPVVTITGPRQSGKTTLARYLFPNKPYISLEDLDQREFAGEDPRGFLDQFPDGAVLDEIQRVQDLLSYIQTLVDNKNREGLFILTGSRQFEMMSRISQSLAGRTALVKLLPLSYKEAYQDGTPGIDSVLYTGFYPGIFDKKINPADAFSFYVSTYIERDVRQLLNIRDLSQFETFIQHCAGRTGQLLNQSSLCEEVGVSQNTTKSWLSVLEASYIIKLLKPYHKRITRRLVKTPKLYFLDTGLAANLIGIRSVEHLNNHPLRGALFETYIVSEVLKGRLNQGLSDNLFFYRDQKGHELDLVIDNGYELDLIEVKSSKTLNSSFLKGFSHFPEIENVKISKKLIYGGDERCNYHGVSVHDWRNVSSE